VEPRRGDELASGVARLDEEPLFGEVAGRASAGGDALLGSVRAVAVEAAAHAWKLVERRELERPHVAMATRAIDGTTEVKRVIEAQIRRRDFETRDALSVAGLVAHVTEAALPDELVRARDR